MPQPYSNQQRQQYRDPADAYYPAGSAPVQSDMGNAYGYNTSRDDVSLSDMARAAATGGLSGHVARQLVGQPQPYGYNRPRNNDQAGGQPVYRTAAQQYEMDAQGTMPSPLAPSGGWLSRAQESLSKYYGMGRDFLSDVNSPETRRRVADLYSQNPEYSRQPGFSNWVSDSDERLDEYEGLMGDSISRSLIGTDPMSDEGLERARAENQDEYNSRFDALAQPMRAAAHARQSVDAIRGPAEQREIERVRGESAGMTPEEIEQGNQEMYDENGNIRGTEPSIRGRLHDQDMAGARGTYEGRSENIPYDQGIMNRAAEGANRQAKQDFLAGKPGFAQGLEAPPAETATSIRGAYNQAYTPYKGMMGTAKKYQTYGAMSDEAPADGGLSPKDQYIADRKAHGADLEKVRVDRRTGEIKEYDDPDYDEGVDITQDLYNRIQNGEESPNMIRNVIRQNSRVPAYRDRQGGMSSAMKTRLDNKARALDRGMRGRPKYDRNGRVIGRTKPVITRSEAEGSMSRSTGGMDYLAGAGRSTGMALDFDEPAPLRPEPSLAGASWALAGDRPTNKFIQATAQNRLRMNQGKTEFDRYSKGIINSFGIGEAVTYGELNAALDDKGFNDYLEGDSDNAHQARLSVLRRIQHMHAGIGRGAGNEVMLHHVQSLGSIDRSDPTAVEEWLNTFRTMRDTASPGLGGSGGGFF